MNQPNRKLAKELLIANIVIIAGVGVTLTYITWISLPEYTMIPLMIFGMTLLLELMLIIVSFRTLDRVDNADEALINSMYSSLADKMMMCQLRLENGSGYCVKCPDSYACAAGKYGDTFPWADK